MYKAKAFRKLFFKMQRKAHEAKKLVCTYACKVGYLRISSIAQHDVKSVAMRLKIELKKVLV